MAHQGISFEWHFAHETDRWPRIPRAQQAGVDDDVHANPGEQWLVGWLLRMATLTVASIMLAAATSPTPAASPVAAAMDEVRAALALEEAAWKGDDPELFNTLLDNQIGREWRREWRVIWAIPPQQRTDMGATITGMEPLGELVVVNMLVAQPPIEWWRAVPFQELRYYRQAEHGWVRTVPDEAYWGKPYALETPHLRFEFTERDAALVLPIANQMEAAYLALHELLQLSPPTQTEKFTLTVVPEIVDTWRTNRNAQRISSPRLAPIALGMSQTDHLADEMFDRMAGYVLNQMLLDVGRSGSNRWRTVSWALRGRLCQEILARCSPWYEQAQVAFAQERFETPDQALRLIDIQDRYGNELRTRNVYLWEYGATDSMLDYVISAYGWARAPSMVRGFGQFSFWSGVIPAVFQQSVPEFEREWNRHLQERW